MSMTCLDADCANNQETCCGQDATVDRRCQSVPSACGREFGEWLGLPSLISALAAFLAVVAGQRFTNRKDKRDGQVNEFHWMIGLITSESLEPRRIGEVLLKDAVDHPERRDSAAQAQIIAI